MSATSKINQLSLSEADLRGDPESPTKPGVYWFHRKTTSRALTSVQGEVLRVEGHTYVVREQDGKVVRLHVDATTQMTGDISQGYSIEAQVDDQSHALTLRSTPTTDRRNEKSESMLAQ